MKCEYNSIIVHDKNSPFVKFKNCSKEAKFKVEMPGKSGFVFVKNYCSVHAKKAEKKYRGSLTTLNG